jgi:AcrR family transcriptional regulator
MTAGRTELSKRLAALGTTLSAEEAGELAQVLSQELPGDGRAARSHRTRRAIVDAMRALHAAGDLRPTAARIAEVAGVSRRTVWQHFDDRETLMIEAGRRDLEVLLGHLEPIDPAVPLPQRTARFVDHRTRVFEEMAPAWRAARLNEPFSPQLKRSRRQVLTLARAELRTVFSAELNRLPEPGATELLDALVGVLGTCMYWEALRTDACLEIDAARRTVTGVVSAVLAQAGFDPYPDGDRPGSSVARQEG